MELARLVLGTRDQDHDYIVGPWRDDANGNVGPCFAPNPDLFNGCLEILSETLRLADHLISLSTGLNSITLSHDETIQILGLQDDIWHTIRGEFDIASR